MAGPSVDIPIEHEPILSETMFFPERAAHDVLGHDPELYPSDPLIVKPSVEVSEHLLSDPFSSERRPHRHLLYQAVPFPFKHGWIVRYLRCGVTDDMAVFDRDRYKGAIRTQQRFEVAPVIFMPVDSPREERIEIGMMIHQLHPYLHYLGDMIRLGLLHHHSVQ